MKRLEEKYIDLLLLKCVNFNKSKSLFISYEQENADFVKRLIEKAHMLGIYDIYLCNERTHEKHDILKQLSIDEIDNHPIFNNRIWDEYAIKGAAFIILETEFPGLMDDIEPEKISRARHIERNTKSIFRKLELGFKIPWCIATLPSKEWAKSLFPELHEQEAYEKLFYLICQMCMINTDDPIKSWNSFLLEQKLLERKLNGLGISKLHYKNSLGTDLEVELTPNTYWHSADSLGEDMLVNLPSYETFTNPNFRKTNGIVYSSKPLNYSGGLIKDFYLEFKDGKVIKYGAKEGLELLKGILESDEYASYLGEVALVNHNSPISNTGIVYNNTTIDENASCHLALGNGFPECVKDYELMTEAELIEYGVNPSKNHVDFMIGTGDLEIEAVTNKGKKLIFTKGNFNLKK